jgi:hypothetical protein
LSPEVVVGLSTGCSCFIINIVGSSSIDYIAIDKSILSQHICQNDAKRMNILAVVTHFSDRHLLVSQH